MPLLSCSALPAWDTKYQGWTAYVTGTKQFHVGDGAWRLVGATPAAHAASHTDGTDDIQNATAAQKGVATAVQITKLDAIEALADVTANHAPQAHAGTHVTGGGDTIADAIAAGAAGLMTGADKTKLDGVEALAEVTSAAKVNAAGATMNADADVKANGYVLDEDDMASDDDTKVPTQQSVKKYVDDSSGGLEKAIDHTWEGDDNNDREIDLGDDYDFILIFLEESKDQIDNHLFLAYALRTCYGLAWNTATSIVRNRTMAPVDILFQGKMTGADANKILLGSTGNSDAGTNSSGWTYRLIGFKFGSMV